MAFLTRNKPSADAAPVDDVALESLRRSPRTPRKSRAKVGEAESTVLLDPTEASKTRARRRLIGAIALALAAIVFVPMLFDRAPVVPVDDIGLQIPDRNTPFEGRRGVPDTSRGPLKPSSDLPIAGTPLPSAPAGDPAPAEPAVVAPKPDTSPGVAAEKAPDKAAEKSPEKPPEKPVAKSAEAKPADKARPADKSPAAPPADDPRALAALEGKTALPPASTSTTAPAERTYAVQVAAFSAADKARGVRDQLVAGGLRAYTESVSTAQGLRTRVRLGPFPSREAADRARQKLRTLKLDGSVVPL